MPPEQTRSASRPLNVVLIVTAVWFGVLIVGCAALLGRTASDQPLGLMAAVGLGFGIAVLPVSLLAAWKLGSGPDPASADRRQMELISAVRRLSEESGLSEGAKRVIYRRRERDLLRQAIEQDINAEDWDAAMVLVKELAESFGYRADAEEFRGRVERARAQTLDRKVVEALTALDEHIRARRWSEAYAEAARIQRLYPDSHRVEGLRLRVDEARFSYRKELERRFLLASQNDRVDEAMELLRELDAYLTPTEAGPYQEVARGVIGKLRESLGVRFKLAMQDHDFDQAVMVGEQIVRDFPNTRMAQEVRELMPNLRGRASTRTASRS